MKRGQECGLWFVACALAAMSCLDGAGVGDAAGLAGGWKGTWTKNGDALPVTISFAKSPDGYSGSFDSDALQVVGIPFAQVTYADGEVRFQLKGDQSTTTFEGARGRA